MRQSSGTITWTNTTGPNVTAGIIIASNLVGLPSANVDSSKMGTSAAYK
jgi:hypothetical protein